MSDDNRDASESSDLERSVLAIVDDHEEEVINASGEKVRRKGVFLLPNLITTAALFAGFYAIIAGMKGDFAQAGMAVIVAQFLDGFDGRVARMTNTTSAFGVQYDSLSDMVSFGLAPSLVIFSWGLEPLGKAGWAAAFVFASCAALRLARFNTQVDSVDKKYFVGLASPPAAAVLATLVWTWNDVTPSTEVSILIAFLTIALGLLMVSNIRYTSFKDLNLRGRVPFVVMLAALLVFVVIVIEPSTVLLLMACTYCSSGPVMALLSVRRQRSATQGERNAEAAGQAGASQSGAEGSQSVDGAPGGPPNRSL